KTTGETSAGGAPARWPDTLYTALRGAKRPGVAPPGMLSGSAASGSQPMDVLSKTTGETSAGGAPARWPDTLYTALRGAKRAGGAPPETAGNDPATHRTTYNDPAPERWPDTLYTALRGAKRAGGASPETAGNDPATRGTANANPAPPEASSWIIRDLEAKLSGTELLLGRLAGRLSVAEQMLRGAGTRKFENSILQLFYDTLVNNGVLPEIAENLLKDADCADEFENIDISLIAYIVYNSIIGALGAPEPVSLPKSAAGPASRAFFIGPTGVGKTTTIAKISADLILNQKKRVRLITADTYRIAAVEQLKTYAEILGVGVTVVYSAGDLRAEAENAPEAADVVLIDTAGRSHRNAKEMDELKELLEAAPESEKFLVLSLNMRREDMLAVVDAYSAAGDFRLIFTKLDETDRVGEILNVCRLTGRKLAYVTNGQNVPDDIETARPEALAKALLGIGGGAA
ncbi:MAG: hypothetical protein FWC55_00620, partial [Firmicutes bacterium]|nr:hypothetical protein [Bacillota bacterium]